MEALLSNTRYDASLLALPFYTTHPYMLPFVGRDYESPKHKKLLLIGCNHYMPQGSSIHHNIEEWYENPKLSIDEERYCDTRGTCKKLSFYLGLVDSFLQEIYSNKSCSIQSVAFYNFFLRPADYEGCIKDLWCSRHESKKDIDQALMVFPEIIKVCKPDIVVVMSALVWKYVNLILGKEKNAGILNDFRCCYSPSRHAWNRFVFDSEMQKNMSAKDSLKKWLLKKWIIE